MKPYGVNHNVYLIDSDDGGVALDLCRTATMRPANSQYGAGRTILGYQMVGSEEV
jgi:hypothetical protein